MMPTPSNTPELPASRHASRCISDDDLCSTCYRLDYRPGELSTCAAGFPGSFDRDNYCQSCAAFSGCAPAGNLSTEPA